MGRPNRAADGGLVYHALNRANARMNIFKKPEDYEAFEQVLEEAVERFQMRLLAWCVMPNHWHLVVWPRKNGDLSRFVGWLTLTHTQRWHAQHNSAGSGHVYQGRFKSFPVQGDGHFLAVCRYVERNPLRAKLVTSADRWQWGSLFRWKHGPPAARQLLTAWPVRRSPGWLSRVNQPETAAELAALRRSVQRGAPYGDSRWSQRIVRRLGLESTLRPRGRPRKSKKRAD